MAEYGNSQKTSVSHTIVQSIVNAYTKVDYLGGGAVSSVLVTIKHEFSQSP